MSIYSELSKLSGVLAAGVYTYRGDGYHFEGQMEPEHARMASIMCRATTLATHMQANMMKALNAECGCAPAQGWMVRGEQFSVCVYGDIFCFVANEGASINDVMGFLKENVGEQTGELV